LGKRSNQIEEQKSQDKEEIIYKLDHSENEHNHDLNESIPNSFTLTIVKELDSIKGKLKTLTDSQDYINEKFGTSFTYVQIQHQVNKLILENFGCPDNDAVLLIAEFEKDKINNSGNYKVMYGPKKELRRVIYVSDRMYKYTKKFLDIVIVDATYKRNRFNMPLINVIGINNYGRSILLAFGLMDDEKQDSYNWFFENLKNLWKAEPKFFISDECQEIITGKLFQKILRVLRY